MKISQDATIGPFRDTCYEGAVRHFIVPRSQIVDPGLDEERPCSSGVLVAAYMVDRCIDTGLGLRRREEEADLDIAPFDADSVERQVLAPVGGAQAIRASGGERNALGVRRFASADRKSDAMHNR